MASRASARNQTGVDDPSLDPQPPAEPEAVEEERPGWLPDNFKSPEDFRKSYDEAQATMQRSIQRAQEAEANLQAILEAQEDQQQQMSVQQPGTYDQTAWENAFADNPLAVVNLIAQQAAQQAAQAAFQQAQQQMQPTQQTQNDLVAMAAINALESKYDDFVAYEPRIKEIIDQEPESFPESLFSSPEATARALERVYKMVKADDILSGNEQQATAQEQARLAKMRAQTQGGALGRPESGNSDFAELIRQNIRNAGPTYGYPQT